MSTSALIGIKKDADRFRAVYCHWDGYPEYVGTILYNHYRTKTKVLDLLALGDISQLGERVKPKPADLFGHSFNNPIKYVTVAYARDRGDVKKSSSTFSLNQVKTQGLKNIFVEYLYLFDSETNKWETYEVEKNGYRLMPIRPNYKTLTKSALENDYMTNPNKKSGV